MRKNHRPSRQRAAFELLEPRLLLSSDFLSYGLPDFPEGFTLSPAVPPPGIPVPPNPPSGDAIFVPDYDLIPDYDWWYGCVPTAAGMQIAWWDQQIRLTDPDASLFPVPVLISWAHCPNQPGIS